MSPALADFVFEAANFLLLAAVLGWILFKPVRRALESERERHEGEQREIERLRAEADSLAKEARLARQAAEREVDDRRREILAAAGEQAAKLLEESREREHAERQALRQELMATRKAEAAALAEVVGRLAADSVRQLLESLRGPSLDMALVKAACAELEAMPAEARKSALVESALTLDEEKRTLLRSALGDGFKERVVAELGAGVRVTTPAGQVDATAVSIARRAAQAVIGLQAGPSAKKGGEAGDG